MKNFYICLTLIFCSLIISCTSDDKISTITEEEKLVHLKIETGGELNSSNSPLKTTNKQFNEEDLFGIQVWESGDSKVPYAYVIADDLSKISISFLEGKAYNLHMIYIRNGKSAISSSHSGIESNWGTPFDVSNHTSTQLNKTYYSNEQFLHAFGNSISMSTANNYRETYLEIDRLDSFVKNFIAQEGGVVSFNLKRVVFGLEWIINAGEVDVSEVRFAINASKGSHEYVIPIDQGQGQLKIPYIALVGYRNPEDGFGMLDIIEVITSDNYTEEVPIDLGTQDNTNQFFNGNITVKRKTMHTIEVTLTEEGVIQNGAEAFQETNEMMTGNIIL